ncbi:MAG: FAD-dependent oxidoreductase [Muribaculaceae bacterium]|nr:FAD-dependent oxidoreductase [Muribaculaceae bacterium]
MKYVIIGGVAGGATAAARLRRLSEEAEIILCEKGEYISYANCGLPYYIGGVIADRSKLFVQTPEAFGKRFNIDVRVKSEVLSVDPAAKRVEIAGPDGNIYFESYDKLLLSPGASPVRPPLPGIDSEGIFTLRNVADTDNIKGYMKKNNVKRAVIIGAGFIGLEMAENLVDAGAEVAIVEMADQVMAPLDFSMASIVHSHLLQKGVRLYLSEAVASFNRTADTLEVVFASGKRLEADMVVLSIGVRPNTKLATDAGILTGSMRGIKVNEYLQTSDENIYAVGDAIEYPHPVTGKPWLNYLAGPANRQARIAADNMAGGNKEKYEGAIGTSIAKVFDLTVAATGLAAKRLKADGIDYLTATIHPSAHAGYYPDALPMTIKVVFSPADGRLLGAQVVGFDGVDKRIDQLSQVIKHRGSVADLMETEHAYAPPFSSAKDPVAIAGYVAGNILSGKMKPIYWRQLMDTDPAAITLIDVRTADEYAIGTLKGAVNIPLDDMRNRLSEIPAGKPIVVFCGVGLRGYLASNILRENGFDDVRNLIGGLKTYNSATATLPAPRPFTVAGNRPEADAPLDGGTPALKVDACGLSCPGPILKLKQAMEGLNSGGRLEISATDPGFPRDARAWCQSTGNRFLSSTSAAGKYSVLIGKGESQANLKAPAVAAKGKTFILFSDDLDKALATFVLANGAAATGEKVTIFFTFWGLNAIRKSKAPKVKKDMFGRMFGMMLPSDSRKLKLSKMNMGGLGKRMMRYVMKKKNVESLETLRESAIANGVEFIACQMSMDVMGISKEELLDNVTIGGVATYMNRADSANVNLFI